MSDLISRSALLERMRYRRNEMYQKYGANDPYVLGFCGGLAYVEQYPAVDAVPVVHAALESTGMDEAWCEWGDCTNCGHSNIIGSKYCNKCGAKMDAKEET